MNKIDINNITNIMQLPKRTIGKILKRANKECIICGWNVARCDIHHIIERREGGSDDMNNLIILCPNCHRSIHYLGDEFMTVDKLNELAISNTFLDWKSYYNPKITRLKHDGTKKCLNDGCDNDIPDEKRRKCCSIQCMKICKLKIDWSSINLEKLLIQYNCNLFKIGKIIGVSDNAIRKYCKRSNIEIKKIKYKTKRKILI